MVFGGSTAGLKCRVDLTKCRDHEKSTWSNLLTEEFELVIMIEVVTEEMHGSD